MKEQKLQSTGVGYGSKLFNMLLWYTIQHTVAILYTENKIDTKRSRKCQNVVKKHILCLNFSSGFWLI